MTIIRIIEFLRRNLRTVTIVCVAILALLVVADLVPGLIDKEKAHTRAEQIPGFWAAFGFLGCVLIIFFSKAFGKAGISTREDHYNE